jgi:SAM-dependent methyltransferase
MSLGDSTLADRLLTQADLSQPEYDAPLDLAFCDDCALCQITTSVSPDVLFCNDYPYFSSVSKSLLEHFGASAAHILETRNLGPTSLVVEAASNDGYMLKNFRDAGVQVLGIDPADGPAQAAMDAGIPTRMTFFTQALAKSLRNEEGLGADVFLANNVLAHVPDLNGFVAGIKTLLKADGLAVIEAPYVVDLIDHLEFDTIYHQHLCYFSVTALDRLFKRHGLFLNDALRTSIHGGSLRLFVEPNEAPTDTLKSMLAHEAEIGADQFDYFSRFGAAVKTLKLDLMTLLDALKGQNKTIAGYGAAAKATTLMNYCGIDQRHLDYVVDKNAFKQGRYMGGNHLEIVAPERLAQQPPDYLMILAWNFADEIMREQQSFKDRGGKFIVPIPDPRII